MRQITVMEAISVLQAIRDNTKQDIPLLIVDEDNIIYSICDITYTECMEKCAKICQKKNCESMSNFAEIMISPITFIDQAQLEGLELTVRANSDPNQDVNKDMNQYELAIQVATGMSDGNSKAIMKLLNHHGYYVHSQQDEILLNQSLKSNQALRAKLTELNELLLYKYKEIIVLEKKLSEKK